MAAVSTQGRGSSAGERGTRSVRFPQSATARIQYATSPRFRCRIARSLRFDPVFNDGRSQLLLSLTGVLPVAITNRGNTNTYNCPIAFWLPLLYPAEPPITIIMPTSSMGFSKKKGMVDSDGKVFGGYLDHWNRKSEVSHVVLRRRRARIDLFTDLPFSGMLADRSRRLAAA